MSHVYLFSHVYVFLYLLNYITSLYWKLSENYKRGCRNDQPICKNKGRNEFNELSSNNLKLFQNDLGLVFHTTYSCYFHSRIFSRLVDSIQRHGSESARRSIFFICGRCNAGRSFWWRRKFSNRSMPINRVMLQRAVGFPHRRQCKLFELEADVAE